LVDLRSLSGSVTSVLMVLARDAEMALASAPATGSGALPKVSCMQAVVFSEP